MGTTLRESLREGTSGAHARLESRMRVMDPDLDRAGYAALLAAMRGFYAPVEAALREIRSRVACPAGERTAWLDADLEALGLSGPALPACRALPPLAEPSDVFGCAYVLEGASLGGVLIERHLAARWPGIARRFFVGHGAETGARWRAFLRALEEAWREEPLDPDRVVSTAAATFASLEDWLSARGVLKPTGAARAEPGPPA